ncbi:MAG: response regulator, partial [Betaproteobacteria bacterium]
MPKIRVLVVDDAVVMRRMISEVLGRDPDIEVVGVAPDGHIALQKVIQVNPDSLTMDVEMPGLTGIETVRELRKTHPKLPVIMFSTLTARRAESTLDALAAGATDYVTKPANVGSVTEGLSRLESELVPKIKLHCRGSHLAAPAPKRFSSGGPKPTPPRGGSPSLSPVAVCIGTSTGGPNALADLFAGITEPLPVPVVIVQHMPP